MPPIQPVPRRPQTNIRVAVEHLRTNTLPGIRRLYEPFIRIQEILDYLFGSQDDIRELIVQLQEEDPLANWIFAHKFSGADMGAKINAAIESIPDQARGAFILVESGIYDITTPIVMENRQNIWLMGFGPSTILRPTADLTGTSFFSINGSSNIVLSDFAIDGQNAVSTIGFAISGDGTAANPDVRGVTIQRIRLTDYPNQGITITASSGRSMRDVMILDNFILNHSPLNVTGRNAIHVGGAGSKTRYLIRGNYIHFDDAQAAPVDGNGHGIFVGHGTCAGFVIEGNLIEKALAVGVQLFGRPSGSEATVLQDILVASNNVVVPRANGIAVYGGDNVKLEGNSIRNPGVTGDIDSRRSGIFLSHGITGAATNVAGVHVAIDNNTIHDTDGFMVDGIRSDAVSTFETSGQITDNRVSGYSGRDLNLVQTSTQKWIVEPSRRITMEVPSDSLSVGDNQTVVYRFHLPAGYKFRLYYASLAVDTAPSGGSFTIDVRWINVSNVDQGTIFSPATLSVTAGNDETETYSFVKDVFTSGDRLEFDIDAVNSATRPILQLYGWLVEA